MNYNLKFQLQNKIKENNNCKRKLESKIKKKKKIKLFVIQLEFNTKWIKEL